MKSFIVLTLVILCAGTCFAEVFKPENIQNGYMTPDTVNIHDNTQKRTYAVTKDIYMPETSLSGHDRLYMNNDNTIKTPGGRTCRKIGSFLECN